MTLNMWLGPTIDRAPSVLVPGTTSNGYAVRGAHDGSRPSNDAG